MGYVYKKETQRCGCRKHTFYHEVCGMGPSGGMTVWFSVVCSKHEKPPVPDEDWWESDYPLEGRKVEPIPGYVTWSVPNFTLEMADTD